jgi:hypothetical protein
MTSLSSFIRTAFSIKFDLNRIDLHDPNFFEKLDQQIQSTGNGELVFHRNGYSFCNTRGCSTLQKLWDTFYGSLFCTFSIEPIVELTKERVLKLLPLQTEKEQKQLGNFSKSHGALARVMTF